MNMSKLGKNDKKDLSKLGWNEVLQNEYDVRMQNENEAKYLEKLFPGRIASEQKNLYSVFTSEGEFKAILADKLWFNAFGCRSEH